MIDKNKTYTVIGVLANSSGVVLFFKDGESLSIKQGHALIPLIKNEIIPAVSKTARWEGKLVSEHETKNIYSSYESVSSVVKFFRVAKDKLKSLFNPDETEPKVKTGITNIKVGITKVEPTLKAEHFNELLKDAEPSTSPKFSPQDFQEVVDFCQENTHQDTQNKDTVVAVVGGKVIPNAERLRGYIEASSKLKDSKGLDAFLTRLSKVIDTRGHTIQDLLVFLENAELPLANDGRIIAYKRLQSYVDGVYVDCHTCKIKQSVGSVVCTDIDKVDPNRKQDCSYGLHIARRSYLRHFRGNVLVMVYVNPEDFIAVPAYSGSKARVCAYEIIGLIDTYEASKVIEGESVANLPNTSKLLEKAISGQLPKPVETVLIDALSSRVLSVKSLKDGKGLVKNTLNNDELDLSTSQSSSKVHTVETALQQSDSDKHITVEEVTKAKESKTCTKPKKPKAKPKASDRPLSYKEQVASILGVCPVTPLSEKQIDEIKAIRKKSKKGLKALGVPESYHHQFK